MIYFLRLTAAGHIFVFIHSRGDGQIAGEISSVNESALIHKYNPVDLLDDNINNIIYIVTFYTQS